MPLLTTGARDADERQQTLRATIEWSYDLLNAGEQTLFARVAVFVDGCRIEAAEAICDPGSDLGIELLDGLSSLVEKNLVRQRADPDGQPRFWMFEMIREFGLERIADVRELYPLRTRHGHFFLSHVHAVMNGDLTISEELELLAPDNANIHAALAWAQEHDDVPALADAVRDLCRLWLHHGQIQEGLRWAEAALCRRETLDDETLVRLLAMSSDLFRFAGDYERATSLKLECLEIDCRSATRGRSPHGDLIAVHLLAELAEMALDAGEVAQARAYLKESQALGGGARALAALGHLAVREGDLERARSCFENALAGFARTGHSFNQAAMLELLGNLAHRRGDRASAATYFREALQRVEALGDEGAIAECLDDFAALAADEDDLVRAGRLAGAADAFRVEGRGEGPLETYALDALPPEAVEAGRTLTIEEAIDYALNN